MRLHREGKVILIVFFLLFLGISFSFYTLIPNYSLILMVPFWVLFGFIVWFFRNPVRETTLQSHDVIAPVDGKVVVIEEVEEKEYLKGRCIQLSIFMSPLNVHVNRYPVSGKVVYTKYHPGRYLVAFHPKSSELNERTTVVVETENGQDVLFRQI